MLSEATWHEDSKHKLVSRYDKCLNVKGTVDKEMCQNTYSVSVLAIIIEYLGMAKRSLLYRRSTKFLLILKYT